MIEHDDTLDPLTDTAIGAAAEAGTQFIPDAIRNVPTPAAWSQADDVNDVVDFPPTGEEALERLPDPSELEQPRSWRAAGVYAAAMLLCAVAVAVAIWVPEDWIWTQSSGINASPSPATQVTGPFTTTSTVQAAPTSQLPVSTQTPLIVIAPTSEPPSTTVTVQAAPPSSSEPNLPHPPWPGDRARVGIDTDPDAMYFDDLALFNVSVPDPARAIMLGHWACDQMGGGNAFANTRVGAANRMQQAFGFNNISDYTSTSIVSAAADAYCPQYKHK